MQGGAEGPWPGPGRRVPSLSALRSTDPACTRRPPGVPLRWPRTLLGHGAALATAEQDTPLSCAGDAGPLPGAGPAHLDTAEVLVVGGFP